MRDAEIKNCHTVKWEVPIPKYTWTCNRRGKDTQMHNSVEKRVEDVSKMRAKGVKSAMSWLSLHEMVCMDPLNGWLFGRVLLRHLNFYWIIAISVGVWGAVLDQKRVWSSVQAEAGIWSESQMEAGRW